MTPKKALDELQTETRQELELLKVQIQLIRNQCDKAIEGHAFGGELTLALRVRAILDHKL